MTVREQAKPKNESWWEGTSEAAPRTFGSMPPLISLCAENVVLARSQLSLFTIYREVIA